MTADLTREEIERLYAVFARVEDLEPNEIGPLLAHAYAEPARLAAARAEGVREGIEMAARFIEDNVEIESNVDSTRMGRRQKGNRYAIGYVVAIRSLALSPAEAPTTPTVEAGPDICRQCDGSGEGVADTTCSRCNGSGAEPTTLASDGWIEWKGGECPVPSAEVEARLRSGEHQPRTSADGLRWNHPGWPGDIIAYRIVQPAEASAPVAEGLAADPTYSDKAYTDGHFDAWAAANKCIAALEAENKALREVGQQIINDANVMSGADDGSLLSEVRCISRRSVEGLRALLQGQGGADASGGDGQSDGQALPRSTAS